MQNHDLYNVIHEVPKDTRPKPDSEAVVIIDPKRRKAVDWVESRLFNRLYKYYLVLNDRNPANKSRGSFPFTHREDPPSNRSLDLEMDFAVSCAPGYERKMAESLCDEASPAEAFKRLVIKWLCEYTRSAGNSFIDTFLAKKAHLELFIKTKAIREAGINLEIGIRSGKNTEARSFVDSFSVTFRDYDREEPITINAKVKPEQSNPVISQINRDITPEQMIQTEVQEYFSNQISLHNYYFNLRKDIFRQEAKRYLNKSLKTIGYELLSISFERDNSLPLPQESFTTNYGVPYQFNGDSSTVNIKSTVVMDLQDSAKYRIEGSRDLSAWINEQLDLAVKSELLGAKYIDLLLDFDSLEQKIKLRISNAARNIGYSIRHLVTMPELEPYEWLKPFELKTESTEEEFQTSISKFPVKLSIIVNTRLRDLESVKDRLNSSHHIPTEMKKAVIKTTAQFLHSVNPEQFYLNFSHAEITGKKDVEHEIKSRITYMLNQSFNAEVLDIMLRPEETELMRAKDELAKHRGAFKVKVESLDVSQPYDLVFSGRFKLPALNHNGWESFSTSLPSIEQIQECIEESIKTELQNYPQANLIYRTTEELKYITEVIIQVARDAVFQDFGLDVAISQVRRDLTPVERLWKNNNAEDVESLISRIKGEIRSLREKQVDLIINGAPEPQIKAVNQEISRLEEYQRNVGTSGQLLLPGQASVKELPESKGQPDTSDT